MRRRKRFKIKDDGSNLSIMEDLYNEGTCDLWASDDIENKSIIAFNLPTRMAKKFKKELEAKLARAKKLVKDINSNNSMADSDISNYVTPETINTDMIKNEYDEKDNS